VAWSFFFFKRRKIQGSLSWNAMKDDCLEKVEDDGCMEHEMSGDVGADGMRKLK
jgi:hypothetical protein